MHSLEYPFGWRGFHHHASLSIAAYGFLMAERLVAEKSGDSKKTSSQKHLPFSRITSHAAVLRAQRHVPTSITSLRHSLSYHLIARALLQLPRSSVWRSPNSPKA